MAHYVAGTWAGDPAGPTRLARTGGRFAAYVADGLVDRPLYLPRDVVARLGGLESDVRHVLSEAPEGLDAMARFLLRGEAVASSRIEGLTVGTDKVALAELTLDDATPVPSGLSATALEVARNVRAIRYAAAALATAPLDLVGLLSLQKLLLPGGPLGLREMQNWVGGHSYSPLGADYVPPPPGGVPALIDDLLDYLAGGAHGPLLQAALAHAQFETIHPFADGNGRVGRALVHTVMTRRGLTTRAVLPISLALLTRSDEYVQGLTAFRYHGEADGDEAVEGTARWVTTFLDATDVALGETRRLAAELTALQQEWADRLTAARVRAGMRGRTRADATELRLLAEMPAMPVLTVRAVEHVHHVSEIAARDALDRLAGAGVLTTRRVGQTTVYLASEVLDLLTLAERRLASTRWDTTVSRPSRPVPVSRGRSS